MAKFFKTIIILFMALFTSCQEGSEAGDLLGQWRMQTSEPLHISFSGSVAMFRQSNNGQQVFGNFQHVGDSLFIQCYSVYGEQADTIFIESTFGFKPFNNIRVKIAALDNDQLVITKGSQTWSLHKY
jgi:hypothetical protein